MTLTMISVVAFVIGCMTYVCRFRGATRYASVTEYLRKSWPIFAPLNCLLYIFTQSRARKSIIATNDFKELAEIQQHWQTIREEAVRLYQQQEFESTKNPESAAYYDVGFRTFYKYGWSKFYLKWYGYTHDSAKESCPNSVRILKRVPSVNGAMFSILPPGSQLTRHADPIACSLRYHLGLVTPNSDDCFINVDGVSYSWREGEAFLFDETYLHYARNDSDQYRLILMCDIERPMNFIGRFVNSYYRQVMKWGIVPNTAADKRGLANAIFSRLAPISGRVRKLKSSNKWLYHLMKYTLNTTLIVLVTSLLAGLFLALSNMTSLFMS
ncbi:MAG: aspartyl/asparaginyl beta-hydroxylase domain-containing protein [Gammaproteobacteria bacterium]